MPTAEEPELPAEDLNCPDDEVWGVFDEEEGDVERTLQTFDSDATPVLELEDDDPTPVMDCPTPELDGAATPQLDGAGTPRTEVATILGSDEEAVPGDAQVAASPKPAADAKALMSHLRALRIVYGNRAAAADSVAAPAGAPVAVPAPVIVPAEVVLVAESVQQFGSLKPGAFYT